MYDSPLHSGPVALVDAIFRKLQYRRQRKHLGRIRPHLCVDKLTSVAHISQSLLYYYLKAGSRLNSTSASIAHSSSLSLSYRIHHAHNRRPPSLTFLGGNSTPHTNRERNNIDDEFPNGGAENSLLKTGQVRYVCMYGSSSGVEEKASDKESKHRRAHLCR